MCPHIHNVSFYLFHFHIFLCETLKYIFYIWFSWCCKHSIIYIYMMIIAYGTIYILTNFSWHMVSYAYSDVRTKMPFKINRKLQCDLYIFTLWIQVNKKKTHTNWHNENKNWMMRALNSRYDLLLILLFTKKLWVSLFDNLFHSK